MALVTVVRSLVGITLELTDGVVVRPWHFVEVSELSEDMKALLRELIIARVVQVSQVLDGTPLPTVKL